MSYFFKIAQKCLGESGLSETEGSLLVYVFLVVIETFSNVR